MAQPQTAAGAAPAPPASVLAAAGVVHLYVHLPFCVHRCGYCDFVTAVGRRQEHGAYVDAVLAELALEQHRLAPAVETVFVGGGTPTFTQAAVLARLLAGLPSAREVTVEANPETITPGLAALLRDLGVTRVSLGAQSFQPRLLEVLERTASADDVRRAVHTLRDALFDNISLDLLYGIPGQEPSDLDADIAEAVALAPDHLSYYELEAKPGTRFTRAWGAELARQADAMEGYFERVVDALTAAGYRWYETANFAVEGERVGGRDLRADHNLGYWRGRDYLGLGVGAVSTLAGSAGAAERRRNAPSLGGYVAALLQGSAPRREVELLDPGTQARERIMLGLRLDEPLPLDGLEQWVDHDAVERFVDQGLVERVVAAGGAAIRLTPHGRFLGGGVTAELLMT